MAIPTRKYATGPRGLLVVVTGFLSSVVIVSFAAGLLMGWLIFAR